MLHGMQTVLPATRQRWHSCPYPSRSWHSIKRPRRDARLSWPIWMVTYRDGILARRRTVTHPSTNWARRALTSLMRRMPPTTTPRRISCTNLLSHLRGESNQLSQFHPWIWSTEHAHCYKHTISLTTLPTHRFFGFGSSHKWSEPCSICKIWHDKCQNWFDLTELWFYVPLNTQ